MTDCRTEKKIYCFDTSAFVTLSRTSENIIRLPDTLWNQLEEMMESGVIISHKIVFDEISSSSKNPDFITKWISDKKHCFYDKTETQISEVAKIISKFPGLIDPSYEREQADPWLVALAIERSRECNLFETNVSFVVSQENPNSSKKIPAVCNCFGIRHQSLREFFDELGIGTSIAKKKLTKA